MENPFRRPSASRSPAMIDDFAKQSQQLIYLQRLLSKRHCRKADPDRVQAPNTRRILPPTLPERRDERASAERLSHLYLQRMRQKLDYRREFRYLVAEVAARNLRSSSSDVSPQLILTNADRNQVSLTAIYHPASRTRQPCNRIVSYQQ